MEEKDIYFMKRALSLAKKGEGETSPNPLVGAVVVKNNKLVSEAFHKKSGLPHAESIALEMAGPKAKGATLYLNLEPCCHFGRTPPCVDKVIAAGIKRVVIAIKDPNPLVNGKSIRKLKKNNIEVLTGVCREEAEGVNEVFLKNMKKKLPFVAVKAAQSLDGKITTASGQSKWITAPESRTFSRKLRDKYDAVLVGANTLKKDNPKLDGLKKTPYKIVISSKLNLPADSYFFKNSFGNSIVFTSLNQKGKNKLPNKAKVFFSRENKAGFLLKNILKNLYQMGIVSVFVEGGSYTLGRFFEQKLVDKVYFFISPKILGGKAALTSVGADGAKSIKKSIEVKRLKIRRIKNKDILIWGYPVKAG